eukprot:6096867-Amphidinium_carterae.1
MAGQPSHESDQDAQREDLTFHVVFQLLSHAQSADSGRGIRRRRDTEHDPPNPTRRLTRLHRWDPELQTYVRSTSNSPRSNLGNTGYEPKPEDQQDDLEDLFADPGPEAAERYAIGAASSVTPRQVSSLQDKGVLNYHDISDGDESAQVQDRELADVEQQMFEEGVARSGRRGNPSAAAANGQPQTPRINEGLRNELETQLIQMRASGQHAQEELAELRQDCG